MKLLLTSAGISNASIRHGLVELLGKPISSLHQYYLRREEINIHKLE